MFKNFSMQISEDFKSKILEMTTLSVILGSAFLIVNYAHFQLITVNVIMYACVIDAIVSTILVICFYMLIRRKNSPLLMTEFSLVVIASNLLIILYGVMGPTVIDRSLSLYIVNKIDQRGGQVSEASLPDLFVKEYLPEFRLVEVRMTEQVTSGTVTIENGCVMLTPRGRRLSRFVNFYRKSFLPKKRNLMGEITDQLTDPFSNTSVIVDTACPE